MQVNNCRRWPWTNPCAHGSANKGKTIGVLLIATALVVGNPVSGSAALIIEPVFNHVAGLGAGPDLLPFPFPGAINGATGLPFITADEPGEIVTYPAGFPPDPVLTDTLRFYNDTAYDITSFTLSIIGLADEPVPFTFTIARGPVDAVWGDANGDGFIGSSDIFSSIVVSADAKTITFSGGLIPVGGRFTDFVYSTTTAGETVFQAGIDATFDGVAAVPEPATWMLLGTGIFGAWRRMRTNSRRLNDA